MSDYARMSFSLTVSDNSDYSAPYTSPTIDNDTFTPSIVMGPLKVSITTSSTPGINLDTFTAATAARMVIKNHDATNYVSVTCRLMGDADDAVLRVLPGHITSVVIDPVTDLTLDANTAACECTVMVAQ